MRSVISSAESAERMRSRWLLVSKCESSKAFVMALGVSFDSCLLRLALSIDSYKILLSLLVWV